MDTSLFVAVFTFLIIAVMAQTFLFIFAQSLKHEAQTQWKQVLGKLNARLDKIPFLLESFRKHLPEEKDLISEIVALRAASHRIDESTPEKVHGELAISEKLRILWAWEGKNETLQKDTSFLASRNEFQRLEKETEQFSERYNMSIRRYNRLVGFPVLKALFFLFRLRKVSIFEFEGSCP